MVRKREGTQNLHYIKSQLPYALLQIKMNYLKTLTPGHSFGLLVMVLH